MQISSSLLRTWGLRGAAALVVAFLVTAWIVGAVRGSDDDGDKAKDTTAAAAEVTEEPLDEPTPDDFAPLLPEPSDLPTDLPTDPFDPFATDLPTLPVETATPGAGDAAPDVVPVTQPQPTRPSQSPTSRPGLEQPGSRPTVRPTPTPTPQPQPQPQPTPEPSETPAPQPSNPPRNCSGLANALNCLFNPRG